MFKKFFTYIFLVFLGILSSKCAALSVKNNFDKDAIFTVWITDNNPLPTNVFLRHYVEIRKGETQVVQVSPTILRETQKKVLKGENISVTLQAWEKVPHPAPQLGVCKDILVIRNAEDISALLHKSFSMGPGGCKVE